MKESQQCLRSSLEALGDPVRLDSSRNAKENKALLLISQFICGWVADAHGEFLQADSSKHACLQQQTTLAPLFHRLQQPINFKKLKRYFSPNRHLTEVCLPGIQSIILQNVLFCFPDLSYINICSPNMFKTLILHSVELPLDYSTEAPYTHWSIWM